MDSICRFRKVMVFPEKLSPDQMKLKSSIKSAMNWGSDETCNTIRVKEAPDKNKVEYVEDTVKFRFPEQSAYFEQANRKFIQDRIRHLVNAFSTRAETVREAIKFPATPSSIDSRETLDEDQQDEPTSPKPNLSVSFSVSYSDTKRNSVEELDHPHTFCDSGVIDPNEKFYMIWMSIASISVLYNGWVIPLRSTFPYQTPENRAVWMTFDYVADAIYFTDMAFIQPRIQYLQDGFWVTDYDMLKQRYMNSVRFKLDLVSLLPLDLLYLVSSPERVFLRFPRFFKAHSFTEFCSFVDKLLPNPYIIRITKTLMYMMYLIHLNACAYYAFSTWEGIGSNAFVYSGKGNAYIKCFYFATKTATSIGKNPKPTEEWEYMFMTFSWLMGVFVFALLIGQIRDIISTATRTRTDYKKLVDETLQYMRKLNLSQDVQKRIKLWFNYTWETQRALDESKFLECLPHKMKTDIAINVHIRTLSKVNLFADCDEAILRELVLKLKSVIYLPGDIICKKGDVGKEMYIVQSGKVEVIGANDSVLATLSEGSVFGEMSLLGIPGMNRRTADVRCKGYSNLFVLRKSDLNTALTHYPEAQELLNKKAKMLMKKNASLERKNKAAMIVINNPVTPAKDAKLLETVLQILPENSNTNRLLRFGSRGKPRATPEYEKFKKSRNSLPLPCIDSITKELEAIKKEHRQNETWHARRAGNTFQCPVTVHRTMS